MPETPQPLNSALLALAASGAIQLDEDAHQLTVQLRRATMARLIKSVLLAGTLVALLIGVARLNNVADVNRRNGELLVDCTTPGGGCYERGRAETGKAIDLLQRATVAAVECAKSQPTDALIEACVRSKLAVK